MMTNAVSGSGRASSNTNSSSTTKPVADPLTSKDTFLKLLVAQIKNQDPMNPSDGLQCVTQLAQYSSLEQSMETNTQLTAIRAAVDKMAPDDTGTTAGSKS